MKIFTWEEVRDRKVPKKESFSPFLQLLQDKLKNTKGVVAASHFGSTHRGDYDITSDIDVYIIYKDEFGFDVANSIKSLSRTAKDLFIPFTVVAIPDKGILNTDHTPISPRLQQVLAYTAEKDDGCFMGNIKEFLFHFNCLSKEDFMRVVRIDIQRYIGYKLRNYFEGKLSNEIFSSVERVQWMESVTNGFVHTTRGVLASYGGLEFIDGSTSEVWKVLHEYQGKNKAPDLFSEHLGARKGYKRSLEISLFGPSEGLKLDKELYLEMGCKEESLQNFVYNPSPNPSALEEKQGYILSLDVFVDNLGCFPAYVEILINMLK